MSSAKFDDRHFVRGQSLTSAGAKTAIKTSRCRSCAGDADMKSIYTCSIVGVIISQMPDAYIEYIVYTEGTFIIIQEVGCCKLLVLLVT